MIFMTIILSSEQFNPCFSSLKVLKIVQQMDLKTWIALSECLERIGFL